MDRRSAIHKILIAGAASCYRGFAADSDDPGYVIRSDVRLVLLDVSVRDAHGALVSGLAQSDFEVLENGRRQPITVFDKGDIPITVGILVDESRSMGPKRGEVIQAAESLVAASNPRDQFFVLNFNDTVRAGLPAETPFSDRPDQLRDALYRGRPEGRTALNDAIVDGLEQLEAGQRGRKALVVVSDGGDNASENTRREMLERVERSIATVYTVGLFDAQDGDQNPGLLNRLAEISGGHAYFPMDPAGMVSICRKIAADIRSRYTLGYVPEINPGREELRHIQVRVWLKRKRLKTHARTSYRIGGPA